MPAPKSPEAYAEWIRKISEASRRPRPERRKPVEEIKKRLRANSARWQARHRDRQLQRDRATYAANQERFRAKRRRYYHANKAKERAAYLRWKTENPEAYRDGQRRWREANIERAREKDRLYAAKHPHRIREKVRKRNALKRASLHEPYSELEIFVRDRWTCQLCDRPVDPTLHRRDRWAATIDHVIPLSKGGADALANVQLAHAVCNFRKGARVSHVEDIRQVDGALPAGNGRYTRGRADRQ